MNNIRMIILTLSLMSLGLLPAEGKDSGKTIYGSVEDYLTGALLRDAMVYLLNANDSAVIDSCQSNLGNWGEQLYSQFSIPVKREGKYILKTVLRGYQTDYRPLDVRFHSREVRINVPTILMRRPKVIELDEVTVTATKVKFYHNGDTLVYNADAFQLPEGSMLDALIEQLPGAELKSDGRIFVNGKFVKNLLLGGRDFFKGNKEVMLRNLPSYTVKDIKVYEKQLAWTERTGNSTEDKELVMDVGLKKQYNTGWMGNAEAGYGTHDTYLGRAFVMRSTDHSRLAVFGNINNLNDNTTQIKGSDWTPNMMPKGRETVRKAGLNLDIDNIDHSFTLGTNVLFSHTDNKEIANTSRMNFLSSGNTYDRIVNNDRTHDMGINATNNITITPGGRENSRVSITSRQQFGFTRHKDNFGSLSGTTGLSADLFTSEFLDSLAMPIISSDIKRKLMNRLMENKLSSQNKYNGEFYIGSLIKMKHSSDMFQWGYIGTLDKTTSKAFSHYLLEYPNEENRATDYRNRYTNSTPQQKLSNNAFVRYYFFISNLEMRLTLDYTHTNDKWNSSLYRLDKLAGWGADSQSSIGSLPSIDEYLSTLDAQNSYRGKLITSHFTPDFYLGYNNTGKKYGVMIISQAKLNFVHDRYDYNRAATTISGKTRNNTYLNYELYTAWYTKDYKKVLNVNYITTESTPDMLYSIDVRDDSDPMNVYDYYNPTLNNSRTHHLQASYKQLMGPVTMISFIDSHATTDALTMGYSYDTKTGAKTYAPANIDGNWDIATSIQFYGQVGKRKLWSFSAQTVYSHLTNCDMIAPAANASSVKNTVYTNGLYQSLRLDRKISFGQIGVKAMFNYANLQSKANYFDDMNIWSYNYGLTMTLNLPCKFQYSTDLTMYSRRGYNSSQMNSDDLVWNMRLSRPILKGKVVLMADAFDILHQLRNTNASINAQGRVETLYNTLPNYLMLHASYRFTVGGQKK